MASLATNTPSTPKLRFYLFEGLGINSRIRCFREFIGSHGSHIPTPALVGPAVGRAECASEPGEVTSGRRASVRAVIVPFPCAEGLLATR
jgi:hypothetical protein